MKRFKATQPYKIFINVHILWSAEDCANYYNIPIERVLNKNWKGFMYVLEKDEIIEYAGGNGYDVISFMVVNNLISRIKWLYFTINRGSLENFITENKFDEIWESDIPTNQKQVVICQNCKKFHYKGIGKCTCGSKSFASTHVLNEQYIEK